MTATRRSRVAANVLAKRRAPMCACAYEGSVAFDGYTATTALTSNTPSGHGFQRLHDYRKSTGPNAGPTSKGVQ